MDWAEANDLIVDEQNGFRQDRNCIDHVLALSKVIETRKKQGKSSFVAFVDFSKAYDHIDRSLLWHKLSAYGLQGKMMAAMKALYSNVECCVRLNGFRSDWFPVSCGVKQGCNMSPTLFSLFVNDLAVEVKNARRGINSQINGRSNFIALNSENLDDDLILD